MRAAEYDAFSGEKVDNSHDGAIPVFYLRPQKDEEESKRKETPIFRDVEFVRIIVPGSRDEVDRPVGKADLQRWPQHYQAFKDKAEVPVSGTPLDEWTQITRSEAEMLKAAGIKTVEALASMPENGNLRIPGLVAMISRARSFKPASDDLAAAHARIAELEAEVAKLKPKKAKKKAAKKD